MFISRPSQKCCCCRLVLPEPISDEDSGMNEHEAPYSQCRGKGDFISSSRRFNVMATSLAPDLF